MRRVCLPACTRLTAALMCFAITCLSNDLAAAEPVPEAKANVPKGLRGPEAPPSKAAREAHNLAHVDDAPWCEICIDAKGKSKLSFYLLGSTFYCVKDEDTQT